MSTISVNYAAMASGHSGLVATWNRIEALLAELTTVVGGTRDMVAESVVAYQSLAARWSSAAQERQQTLRSLAEYLNQASTTYRQTDAALAAQFLV